MSKEWSLYLLSFAWTIHLFCWIPAIINERTVLMIAPAMILATSTVTTITQIRAREGK